MAKDCDGPDALSLATLDTHEVVRDLLGAGFTDEQAAAVARNLRKAQDLDVSSLATRSDLQGEMGKVHSEFDKVRSEFDKVYSEFGKVRSEIEKLRAEIGKDISDSKVDVLKYLFGTIGFQTLIILGAVVTLIKLVKP